MPHSTGPCASPMVPDDRAGPGSFIFRGAALVLTLALAGCGRPPGPGTGPAHSRPVSPPPPRQLPGPKVGEPAPEIEGEDLEGKTFRLSDHRGQVVFLQFWSSW